MKSRPVISDFVRIVERAALDDVKVAGPKDLVVLRLQTVELLRNSRRVLKN